jgi:hypothetical protein
MNNSHLHEQNTVMLGQLSKATTGDLCSVFRESIGMGSTAGMVAEMKEWEHCIDQGQIPP